MYPYQDSQAQYSDDDTQATHISQTQQNDPWIEAMRQQGNAFFGAPQIPPNTYTDSALDRAGNILGAPSTALRLAPQTGRGETTSEYLPTGVYYQGMPTFAQFSGGRPGFVPSGMQSTFPIPPYTGPTPVPGIHQCPPPTARTLFGPEIGGSSDRVNVGGSSDRVNVGGSSDGVNAAGSSAPTQHEEGEDEDVAEVTEARARGSKRKKSAVWNSMTEVRIQQGDGTFKTYAKCKGCGKLLSGHSSQGTNHLKYHIDKCEQLINGVPVGDAAARSAAESSSSFDPDEHRRDLAMYIMATGSNLNFADNAAWERLVRRSFHSQYQRPSRTTTRTDVIKYYEWKRTEIIGQFVESSQRVALTSDVWSSGTSHDYICICSHFIDKYWTVQKRLIGFKVMDEGHSGEQIADKILKAINDFGITSRIISITMDNASANDRAINILRRELNPMSDPLFFHSRCVAHILNLAVQDGLNELQSSLKEIRRAVVYLNGSHQREERWRRACSAIGLEAKMIAWDIPSRWNSTYLMLQSLIPFRDVFTVWYNNERRHNVLTDEHWDDTAVLCTFLQVFHTATTNLSASLRPTSPIVMHELILLSDVFKRYKDHQRLGTAVDAMVSKFLKYFYPLPHLYAFSILLDPRSRVPGLKTFLKLLKRQLGPDYVSDLEGHTNALQEAYKVYELRYGGTTGQAPIAQTSPASASWRLLREQSQLEDDSPSRMNPPVRPEHNELNVFLNVQFNDVTHDNLDLVAWWRIHSGQFPVLTHLARDILSIPVSTVSAESAFSMADNIIDPHRSRLKPKMVEILTVGKDWELADLRMQDTIEQHNTELFERVQEWTLE